MKLAIAAILVMASAVSTVAFAQDGTAHGPPKVLAPIVGVPVWAFHGAQDNDTDVETGYGGAMVGSRAVIRVLRAEGGKPRYTEYPEEMHPMWHRAYATEGLLPWMLSQRLRTSPCNFGAFGAMPAPAKAKRRGKR